MMPLFYLSIFGGAYLRKSQLSMSLSRKALDWRVYVYIVTKIIVTDFSAPLFRLEVSACILAK